MIIERTTTRPIPSMNDVASLVSRAKHRRENSRTALVRVCDLEDACRESKTEYEKEDQHRIKLEKVLSLLQQIAAKMNKVSEDTIAELGSLALEETFPELQISLKLNHRELRGVPVTEIVLVDKKCKAEGPPIKFGGGGPTVLLGVLLRVITIVRQKNMRRFLILDEPLVAVSDLYIERACKFLKKICLPVASGGLGFDILCVTHNRMFIDASDKSYRIHWDSEAQSSLFTEQEV